MQTMPINYWPRTLLQYNKKPINAFLTIFTQCLANSKRHQAQTDLVDVVFLPLTGSNLRSSAWVPVQICLIAFLTKTISRYSIYFSLDFFALSCQSQTAPSTSKSLEKLSIQICGRRLECFQRSICADVLYCSSFRPFRSQSI